ncbi:hypothetical protein NPIL_285401, partial [Nephila pilipes]
MMSEKFSSDWMGKQEFCSSLKRGRITVVVTILTCEFAYTYLNVPLTASIENLTENMHSDFLMRMNAQLHLYEESMERMEAWKNISIKVKSLKRKLDALENSKNPDKAKI